MKRERLLTNDVEPDLSSVDEISMDIWNQAIEEFLENKTVYSKPRTVDYYSSHLKMIVEWAVANGVTIDKFTPAIMGKYLIARSGNGVTDSTRRKDCQTIKAFFEWCVDSEYIKTNRFVGYRIIKAKSKVMTAPPDEDVQKLLNAIEPYYSVNVRSVMKNLSEPQRRFYMRRLKLVVYLAVDTGARIDEILEIRLGDIPPLEVSSYRGALNVSGELTVKAPEILLRFTKSGHERPVPASRDTINCIKDYLRCRPRDPAKAPSPDDHLIVNDASDKADQHVMRRILYLVEKFAECSRMFGFHDLRRYAATKLAQKGIKEAQAFLGHRNIQTTSLYLTTTRDKVSAAHAAAAPLSQLLRSNSADKMAASRSRKKSLLK